MALPPPLQTANAAIEGLQKTQESVVAGTKVLDRLESLVHVSRAEKAPDVKVADVKVTTITLPGNTGAVTTFTAKTGDNGQYNTRISLAPKPGFKCTCPDLEKRRQACKHVAALAVASRKRLWALSDLLQSDIDRLTKDRDELAALYEALPILTGNLTTRATDALQTTFRTLES